MFRSLRAAQAGLNGAGDDLFQRGIGDQEGRDNAGMRRIGAAQFQRRRRAIGFGIAGVGGQSGIDLVGAADDRIEAVEGLVAVERAADLILQRDAGDIEPAAAGDREGVGDVERVERIKPGVLIGGAKRDRADRNRIAGWSEKYPAAAHDKVRTDGAEFRAGRELGDAVIEAGADHETIVVSEQLVGVGRLQRHARSSSSASWFDRFSPSTAAVIERIGELGPVQAVGGRTVVAKAKQRRIGGARLGAGRIAVQRVVIEDPHMRVAFDGPGRRGLDLAGQIDVADAIGRGLRRGVGRPVILLEQFDRHGGRRAELVVGRAHVEMEFAAVVLVADIAIEAANVGRRKIAKPVVVQAFERAIDGKLSTCLPHCIEPWMRPNEPPIISISAP